MLSGRAGAPLTSKAIARMHTIRSTGLSLEPQVAAHADEMFAVLSDPAIYEYERAPPASVEQLRERFTRLESRRSPDGEELWLNWVIRLSTSPLIGYVQATLRPNGRAAIAYELSSAYWGRGLAHEAVQAMISELVQYYEVRHLFAVLKRKNLRSSRLLGRLGFLLSPLEEHVRRNIDADEQLMHCDVQLA